MASKRTSGYGCRTWGRGIQRSKAGRSRSQPGRRRWLRRRKTVRHQRAADVPGIVPAPRCFPVPRDSGSSPSTTRFSHSPTTRHRLMHLPAQLLLDCQQLRPHPLRRGSPPYDEMPLAVRPAIMREPQKRRTSLVFPLLAASGWPAANRPNSISRVFSGWSSSPNFASRS